MHMSLKQFCEGILGTLPHTLYYYDFFYFFWFGAIVIMLLKVLNIFRSRTKINGLDLAELSAVKSKELLLR